MPPENIEYLYLGLVAVFGFMGIFIASMMMRYRNLQKDIQVINQLRDE